MSSFRTWRSLAAAVSAALLTAGLAACGGSDDDAADAGSQADPGNIVIKMYDSNFKPADLTVTAGETVTFQLPNIGQLPHNMRIATPEGVYRDSTWVSTPEIINPERTGTLTWEAPADPGKFKYRCDIHPDVMVGTITVE
ncbi:MAG: cupredoxin domain-containing protein [Dehalococcoidia bacterium]